MDIAAEVYAGGKCEESMGAAIKKFGWKRSDFVISTYEFLYPFFGLLI